VFETTVVLPNVLLALNPNGLSSTTISDVALAEG